MVMDKLFCMVIGVLSSVLFAQGQTAVPRTDQFVVRERLRI